MWRLCEKQQKLLSPAIDSNYCGVLVEFLSIMPHQISRQLFNTLSAFTTLILLLAVNTTYPPTYLPVLECRWTLTQSIRPTVFVVLLCHKATRNFTSQLHYSVYLEIRLWCNLHACAIYPRRQHTMSRRHSAQHGLLWVGMCEHFLFHSNLSQLLSNGLVTTKSYLFITF